MALHTERNRDFFVDNGYKFVFDKLSKKDDAISFWRCEHKNKDPCPARIHVKDGIVIKQMHQHNHASNPAAIEVTRIRTEIKRRAIDTQEVRN